MKPYLFILAGGRGERLWPLSTAQHAKPFLTLFEGKSLIELTCTRLQGLTDPDRLFIVTTADLRANVQQALPDFPDAQLLCEPEARNTAAAMAWICGYVRQRDPEGVVAVLPADHLITPDSAFREALQTACAVARREAHIVTLGIHPTRPATEYGYIACGEAITTPAGVVRKGIGFTEKPAVATAQTYLNAGNFLWNAGIFVWQAAALEAEFRRSAPAFLPLIEAPDAAASLYPTLPKIAFDYAIMEHCATFDVIPGTFDWNDVGSYAALAQQFPADANSNRAHGVAYFQNASDCTVLSTDPNHTIVLAGTANLLVAHTPEITLICPADQAHHIPQWTPPELR